MNTATAHRQEDRSCPDPQRIKRRRAVPPGVLLVRGNPGLVLRYLWDRAPWSQGPVAFVWPKVATIAADLGMWESSVYTALAKLRDVWIYRETRRVRFEGRMVDRYGWVLLEEASNGELFARIEREGTDGDLEVEPPSDLEVDPPENSEVPSYTGTGSEPNSSSAHARASAAPTREPGEDEEDSAAPIPPKSPPPRPTPPPDEPRPAAVGEIVERDLWDTAEQERYAQLGGDRPRPFDDLRRAAARRLLDHVMRNDRCDEPAARMTVEVVLRARVAYARRKRAEGASHYEATLRSDPFSIKAYEHVVAFERTKPAARTAEQAAEAWRKREWNPDWVIPKPPPEPAPARKISNADMQRMIDETLAEIRAAEGRS